MIGELRGCGVRNRGDLETHTGLAALNVQFDAFGGGTEYLDFGLHVTLDPGERQFSHAVQHISLCGLGGIGHDEAVRVLDGLRLCDGGDTCQQGGQEYGEFLHFLMNLSVWLLTVMR